MPVRRRADGGPVVQHKKAVVDHRIAVENVDDRIAVVSGKINELDIVKSDLRFDEFDAGSIAEVHPAKIAVRGILESHAEGRRAINPDACSGVFVDQGAFDGDEGVDDIDSGHMVVEQKDVVVGDGEVVMDGKGGAVVGDGAVAEIDQVVHGVGGTVAWAYPLGVRGQ